MAENNENLQNGNNVPNSGMNTGPDEFFGAEDLERLAARTGNQQVDQSKKEEPKPKNLFDMEGDDLGEIVEKKPLTREELRAKRPVMSDLLSSVLNEEDPQPQPQAQTQVQPQAQPQPQPHNNVLNDVRADIDNVLFGNLQNGSGLRGNVESEAENRETQQQINEAALRRGLKIPGMDYIPQKEPAQTDKKDPEPQVQEQPKTTISSHPIPGMSGEIKIDNSNPPLERSEEERAKQNLEFAKNMVEELKKQTGGGYQSRIERERLIKQYQAVIDSYLSPEEQLAASIEATNKARQAAEERERLKKEQENIQTGIHDILEDVDVAEKNNDNIEVKENLPEEKDTLQGVDILAELNNPNVIAEADEDEEDDEIDKEDKVNKVDEATLDINANGAPNQDQPIVNENPTEEKVKEDKNPPVPQILDFYQKLEERMKSDDIAKQVRAEMADIFKDVGVANKEKIDDLVDYSYFYIKDTINSIYYPDITFKAKMSLDAPLFFENAFLSIVNSDLSPQAEIIAAQRIADVMLKNYSPVAFIEKGLDHYADNYVLKNRELLADKLTDFKFKNVETLINDIEKALVEGFEPEPIQEPDPGQFSAKVFYDKLKNQMGNTDLTAQVRSEIGNVLRESGVDKQSDIDDAVNENYSIVEMLDDAYEPTGMPEGFQHSMKDIVKFVFTETYESISKKDMSIRNKLVAAQRISDVILKSYSPAAFADGKMDQYANCYVLGNKEILRDCLGMLKFPQNEIEAIMQRDMIAEFNKELEEAKKPVAEQKKPEAKAQTKPSAFTAFDDDDFISAAEEDSFEKRLAEQQKAEKEKAERAAKEKETPPVNREACVAVYMEKLKGYNNMYKLDINADAFAASVSDAWALMRSGDQQKIAEGFKVMNTLFKDTLGKAFKVEKNQAYNEHRLPEYAEIIKSSNELLRSAMFGFTDLYHAPKMDVLFKETAFGGLNAKDLANLTVGKSLWSMDQKSDEAWEIQSKEAKSIADGWLKEEKPYEKMINEMKAIVDANKKNIVSRKEVLDKLTAAEWLLENDEKMMVEDPADPYNPIPNWGNRYWKALTEAREALGIDKHTSMRDLIQANYESSAKAVRSSVYNERQIRDYVLDPSVREIYDSMELQKEEFATQSAHVTLTEPKNEKTTDEIVMTADRVKISVKTLDEREIMKNEPKNYNFIIEQTAEIQIGGPNQGPQA